MDNRLRAALERRGLPAGASKGDAQDFYAGLDLEAKGKLGVELGTADVRVHGEEPLQTRSPATVTADFSTRMEVRAQTIDEQARTVEAVIATDLPVEVWDWRRGETIDEVLLADGARLPDQLPLLNAHGRWDLDDVLGSARDLRRADGQIVARLHFAEGDPDADRAWNKARQGHLTDVSVGYRVSESVLIEPGQTATVAGRSFTAGKRALRIATVWTPREVSLVPIGADQAAKLRDDSQPFFQRGPVMDPKLREYLESIGLRAESTDAEAEKFSKGLEGDQRKRAEELLAKAAGQDPDGQRTAPGTPTPANPPADPPPAPARSEATDPPAPVDVDAAVRAALDAERRRSQQITELAGRDVPAELCERAINEGWDLDRAAREFLPAVRERRGPEGPPIEGGPAIHSRSHEIDCNVRSLAAGLLADQDLDPTQCSMYRGRVRSAQADRLTEQDADRGEEFRGMSAFDLLRECIRIDSGRWFRSPDAAFEHLRTAPSSGALSYVFGTNVYAKLVAGWQEVDDSTVGWCSETDESNFLEREDISLQMESRLKQLPRGGTADDASLADTHETYRIARFARKFTVDEQDIIDDRLAAIMGMPVEMGSAARRLRPDLVYATMLANPSLIADSTAVFHADHANLGSAALGAIGMKLGIVAMGSHRDSNDVVLNIRPKVLIVPAALTFEAAEVTSPAAILKLFALGGDPQVSTENLVARYGVQPIVDDRIGAGGVVDPRTETSVAGSATNWFLGAGGSKSIRVAYRRGTNRQPSMRSYTLDQGQWGLGWDIKHDIGVAFMDYLGWYKSTGLG